MTSRPTAAGINPDVESDLDQCGARPARDAISDQEAVHLWTSKDIEGSVAAQLDSGGCQVVRANRLAAGARTRRGRWLALVGLVPVGTFLVPVAPAEAYALLGCQYGVSSATWHYATGYPPPSGYDTPTRNAAASWGAATRFDWNYVDSVYAANVVIANYGNTGWDGLEREAAAMALTTHRSYELTDTIRTVMARTRSAPSSPTSLATLSDLPTAEVPTAHVGLCT